MSAIEQILTNPIVAQFVGLVVGLVASFFSWWVLFRWLAPSIALSTSICKSAGKTVTNEAINKSGFTYNVQFANIGYRTIVDLQVRALIRIKGLVDPESSTWQVTHFAMRDDGDKIYSYPNVNPIRRSRIRWTLPLYINSVESFKKPPFPAYIRAKAEGKSLLLEELLSLGSAAEIRVIASGYDEFSGAKKIFERTYFRHHVKFGRFEKGEVVEEPNPSIERTA